MKTPKNVHLLKRHGRQPSLVRSLAAKVIFCPVVWSKPFSSGIGLPLGYVFIYHFTGLEVHFPGYRTPPSLRQRLGLPPLCAFLLWFYDRLARLNSFFTYAKYITLPIIWIQTTYNKSVYKYWQTMRKQKSCAQPSVRDCTIWDEAQLVAASPRESPLCQQDMVKFSDLDYKNDRNNTKNKFKAKISRYILIFILSLFVFLLFMRLCLPWPHVPMCL